MYSILIDAGSAVKRTDIVMNHSVRHDDEKEGMCMRLYLAMIAIFGLTSSFEYGSAAESSRITSGLLALYEFKEADEVVVRNSSDAISGLDLHIADPTHVRRQAGQIEILEPTVIMTRSAAIGLIESIQASGELTVEVWCEPKHLNQKGPARIVSISADSSRRNVTVGQDKDHYDVRLRSTRTSINGIPSVATPPGSARTQLVHLVCTRIRNGLTRIYSNGQEIARKQADGDLSNWDPTHHLALANEVAGGRPWLGTLHLVAVYNRALPQQDVGANYEAGPEGTPSEEYLAQQKRRSAERHFETVVAPILAKHCLECHDAAIHENGIDLSHEPTEIADVGRIVIPGNHEESPLWTTIAEDTMPPDRPPLSDSEKAAIQKWIDDGAVWSLKEIDPAVYVHGGTHEVFVRRLTVPEYIETVRTALGVDIKEEAERILPPDIRADGFRNTAYNLSVDLKHVDAWDQLANIIVDKLNTKEFVSRFSKKRRLTDKDTGAAISRIGKWLLRGPIQEKELIAYRGITTTVASAGGSFDEAMMFVIRAMLQSPRFIYRIENQRGDGSRVSVDQYELASRMSYTIWGGPPDKPLFKLAEQGRLSGEVAQEQTKRMLNDPRARTQSLRFIDDWLNLNRLNALAPDAKRFPEWNAQLALDMRQETRRYFQYVAWDQQLPLTALFNTQVTFASPELAAFYGLKSAEDESSERYDLAEVSERGGLLTQGSFLTIGGDEASMVTRGLSVMHELLRGVVKDPPACVDTSTSPTEPGVTQRSQAVQRIINDNCGGCHSKFEPLAFGLEKYDGIGRWRESDEHGNQLREDGNILFPGTAAPVEYTTAAQLMDLLATSDRVSNSLTWKVAQFAVGRPLGAADAAIVNKIHQISQKNGGTWQSLITAVLMSDLIQMTQTEPTTR